MQMFTPDWDFYNLFIFRERVGIHDTLSVIKSTFHVSSKSKRDSLSVHKLPPINFDDVDCTLNILRIIQRAF